MFDFFASFCWFLDFLLEILKLKKKSLIMSVERLDKYKNFVCLKYYFQKIFSNMRFLIIYILVQIPGFFGILASASF